MRCRVDKYTANVTSTQLGIEFDVEQKVYDALPDTTVTGESEPGVTLKTAIIEAIRLIADETQGGYVVCSTGQKLVVNTATKSSVEVSGETTYSVAVTFLKSVLITAADGDEDDIAAINNMANTDMFTIAVDWGETITGIYEEIGDVQDVLDYIAQGGMPEIDAIAKQGTNANATNTAILTAVENIDIDTSTLAKEASVKDGNDTAISVSKSVYGALTDNTTGLSAIKNAIPTVADIQNGLATSSALASVATDASNAASDAAAAKFAAQAITGYALQGSGNSTQTDIASAIGTPATGQPNTLFAAIAAGGGGGGGGDATAANQQTIIAAVSDNGDDVIDVAKRIDTNLGDSTSTESSPTTLWGKVKQLYNYVSTTIAGILGTPASGHTIAEDAGSAATDAAAANTKLGTLTSGQTVYGDMAKEAALAKILKTSDPMIMQCSSYTGVSFVRVGYTMGYYKWIRVDGYDMYLYTSSGVVTIGAPCYSSINPAVQDGTIIFLKNVSVDTIDDKIGTVNTSGGQSVYGDMAKEANATSNKNQVISAIGDTLSVNMLATGLSSMAGVPMNVITDDGTTTAYTLNANELYYFNNRSSDLELTLDLTTVTQGEAADFHFIVQVNTGPLTVTIKDSNNSDVVWSWDVVPDFATGFTYEVGIINNLALYVEYVV